MRTIATPPEVDLTTVAKGDFSKLSQPLIIAAASRDQFDAFLWREALICHEVRRFRDPSHHRCHPENKILLLLPGYEIDPKTAGAVEWWVNQEDRYTVQLNRPEPTFEEDGVVTKRSMILMSVAMIALFAWLIFR
jgi:hypothetical protein